MKRTKYIPACVIIIVIGILSLWNINGSKNHSDYARITQLNYSIEEYGMEVESINIHIDIKYPSVSLQITDSSQSNFISNTEKQKRINELLTPPEIQYFYNMIANGLIQISDTGELEYAFSPHNYSYGVDNNYTMGFMSENFLNLFERSISYTHNSDWRYRALLIDMNSGEEIMSEDFFDASAFHEYILNGAFKANKEDFDIQSYFSYITDPESLSWYLYRTFINQERQVEVLVIFGEGPETIMYADLDDVTRMINPKFLAYLQ